MPLPKPDWRVYAGAGLLVWAAGLQVRFSLHTCYVASVERTSQRRVKPQRQYFLLQVHMWYLQKQPGFKEKFQPDKEEEPSEYVTVRLRGR